MLGDRTLDEISNTRLFRLKQRTLPWRYEIIHMPGKTNNAADATSRHPSCQNYEYVEFASNNLLSDEDNIENIMAASISRDASANFSLSWEDLASETSTNATLRLLMNTIKNGFPTDRQMIDEKLHPFWPLREALHVQEGVIIYNDRVVIPPSLRKAALDILHSAHQGISAMEARARSIIFWPGITNDIKATREACTECCRNAPSQPAMPAISPIVPSTPFEAVAADFFDMRTSFSGYSRPFVGLGRDFLLPCPFIQIWCS